RTFRPRLIGLDGVKMLALAGLGAAAATMALLPRWLRYTGLALAIAITASGLVYVLLLQPLAAASRRRPRRRVPAGRSSRSARARDGCSRRAVG
ncbi:MAG TPA: hypothetical protein VED20_16270, partial [Streptosporangiaceae bacterium]|nr:hypothetical protein [Streptosporangiaceae bacterium]